MQKVLCTLSVAILSAALGSVALAADIARPVYKAPAAAPAPFSWTGFYIGGHVGYGWADTDATIRPNSAGIAFDAPVFNFSDDGAVGGGQIGYNWQFAPNWLIGIEGDISATGIGSSSSATLTIGGVQFPPNGHSMSYDIDWVATLRGRLGYTWDRSMLYLTGGFAWADVKGTSFTMLGGGLAVFPGSFSDTVSGWTIGGGWEWAFAPNWSARLEYLYYDLDGISGVSFNTPPTLSTANTWNDTELHVVRIGVNYRFGDYGKAPVVAKY